MNRFATRLGAGAWLGALLLFPTAALAVPFTLTNLVEPCNVGATRSCVKIADTVSATWPDPTTFQVQYDLEGAVGDVVPLEIIDLFIPTLVGSGVIDVFTITSPVVGTFDQSNGFIELSFDMFITRNGASSSEFTYSMSTGTESDSCNGVGPIDIPGSNHNPVTNAVAIVGIQCVDIAPPGSPVADDQFVMMSLMGTVPVPHPVPSLGSWGIALLVTAILATGRSACSRTRRSAGDLGAGTRG
jgi:hypothetical protein